MNAAKCRCLELEDEQMKRQHIVTSLTITAIFVAAIGSQARQTQATDDGIIASFDRALHHEAGPATPTTRPDIDNDLLYEMVNQPLRTQRAAGSTNLVPSGADND
jgi:Holliday junction resolvase RusA-like endonuclease